MCATAQSQSHSNSKKARARMVQQEAEQHWLADVTVCTLEIATRTILPLFIYVKVIFYPLVVFTKSPLRFGSPLGLPAANHLSLVFCSSSSIGQMLKRVYTPTE